MLQNIVVYYDTIHFIISHIFHKEMERKTNQITKIKRKRKD